MNPRGNWYVLTTVGQAALTTVRQAVLTTVGQAVLTTDRQAALTTVRQAVLAGVEADPEPWASRTFIGLSLSRAPTRASCPQAEKPGKV